MFARSKPKPRPAIPFGHRVYAIGDVHGEADLLRRLLRLIKEDNAARRDADVTIVFLGDLIDRGPDAAALLETFARMQVEQVVTLQGNHEEALVQAYGGDDEVLDAWMPFGAMATLTGFGVTLKEIDSANTTFTAALQSRIAPDLIAWLQDLPSAWECGDYYFTHAGIRPGIELDEQVGADLRWIREPFLSSRRDHGKVIVHGHTVEPGTPTLGGNRIGIDTGAHEHGVLTALGLEGERQWLLQATGPRERDDPAAAPEEARSLGGMPQGGEQSPMQDIVALITSIVVPTPEPPDATLVLRQAHEPADDPLRPVRKKKLGTKGYAAAGFALVLASVGGYFAVRPTLSPTAVGGVSVPIPDLPGGSNGPAATPMPVIAARPQDDGGPQRGSRGLAYRRASPNGVGKAGKLRGEALTKALEEDRATTRRLNADELSRQSGHDLTN